MAQPSTLIVLNGGSSAGKTTLGRALQDVMSETYLLLGIDAFWSSLPPKQLDLNRVEPHYYSWDIKIEDGLEYFTITPGPILDKTMLGRYLAIEQFLKLGFNVVADDVMWKRDWLLDALRIFSPYRVYMVGVFVSDAEGARRETQRGDRHAGWDRGSARYAHHDAIYDLKIDTTFESPQRAAREIKASLDAGLRPGAFVEMRRRFL
ncbi:MAG: phosphotransferase-like protein, partial [Candidatus Binataceae bacterium]